MKRISTFIGLKITEISAVVFVPWGLGLVWQRCFTSSYIILEPPHPWAAGLVVLGVGLLVFLFGVLNWEWAKKLTK